MAVPAANDEPVTVGVVLRRARDAVAREFPGQPWVCGEVRSVKVRNGHCWFELVDPGGGRNGRDAVLGVVCWQRRWRRVEAELAACGSALVDGVVLTGRGPIRLWEQGGRLQLDLQEVDVSALVGALARRRAAIRARLEVEGLLGANRRRPVPPVPLRVGLVASRGTEGARDFLGVIERSGYAFDVRIADSRVQGPGAPDQIVAAIDAIAPAVDVVAIVRGGGSASDLVAFDDERVARAVGAAPVPVFAGVGHTGDRSLLDEVAGASFPTPTACAQALVTAVDTWCQRVDARVARIGVLAHRVVEQAHREVAHRRDALVRAARHGLAVEAARVAQRRAGVDAGAHRVLDRSGAALRHQAGAILRCGPRALGVAADSVAGRCRRLGQDRLDAVLTDRARTLAARRSALSAFDPERQLARGWAVVRDRQGRVVRDAATVARGDRLRVELGRGALAVEVDEVVARREGGST